MPNMKGLSQNKGRHTGLPLQTVQNATPSGRHLLRQPPFPPQPHSAYIWVDTHAHLFDYTDNDLGALIDEAIAAGVATIVNTAVSIDTARTVLSQCKKFPNVLKPAVGISPFDSVDVKNGWDDELKTLVNNNNSQPNEPPIIAIGEIGLDNTNPIYPSLDIQLPIFKKQLEIANDANLPVIIHSRGMEKQTAEICSGLNVTKAIFHCFTGDKESLDYIINCGYYISIPGIVTYKNSHLRDLIRHIPINRLLIETDAPYLSPAPHRGKPNKPPFLIHTAKYIAELLDIDEAKLAKALLENVIRVFDS
ncbi:MAG: TatD family hydrolase [Chitinispirillales bacterium]|jgi:TatD DNase family protein|nr:TatD family hydrolase [Chitinispirillales bacterium]